mgnify:CR=1 FL=1
MSAVRCKAVGRIFAQALGVLVLVLLGVEFVARLLADVHVDKPGIGGHPTAGRPQHVAPYRMRVVKREFHSPQLNIDEDGFRSGKVSGHLMDDWNPSRYNVFVFGGSAIFGWTVDDGQTIPAQLEALAHQQGLNWRVYNLGVTDYSIHDEVQILMDQLREGRIPNAIIFYDGVNETGRDGLTNTNDEAIQVPYRAGDYEHQWVEQMVERGQKVNLDNLAMVKLGKRLCRRWGFCYRPAKAGETVVTASDVQQTAHAKEAAHAYVQYARMVNALGRTFGFQSLFILQPIGACVENPAAYSFPYLGPPRPWQYTYAPKLYADIMNMASPDIRVVNLCQSLNGKIAEGMQPFSTPLHLNAEGHAQIVARILGFLRESGGPPGK